MKKLIALAALATLAACDPGPQPNPDAPVVPIEDECPAGEVCP